MQSVEMIFYDQKDYDHINNKENRKEMKMKSVHRKMHDARQNWMNYLLSITTDRISWESLQNKLKGYKYWRIYWSQRS